MNVIGPLRTKSLCFLAVSNFIIQIWALLHSYKLLRNMHSLNGNNFFFLFVMLYSTELTLIRKRFHKRALLNHLNRPFNAVRVSLKTFNKPLKCLKWVKYLFLFNPIIHKYIRLKYANNRHSNKLPWQSCLSQCLSFNKVVRW